MFLAYIDIRSFLYIVGLLLFAALSLLVCWATKARFRNRNVVLFSALLFTGLFTFFLTGLGPFIDHKEIREYPMSWEIKPNPSDRTKEAEVVLSFVDFPGYYVGEYSDELAAYLRERGEQPVKVVFEVTTDYRKVRGFNEIEIAGLRSWRSQPRIRWCGWLSQEITVELKKNMEQGAESDFVSAAVADLVDSLMQLAHPLGFPSVSRLARPFRSR